MIESAAKAAVAKLSPVLDFISSDNLANLDAATLTDGDSYIITGSDDHKSDIAIWDGVNLAWIYYVPKNNDATTVTTGIYAGQIWTYNLAADIWAVDSSSSSTGSSNTTQPLVGNLLLSTQNQTASSQ